MYVCVANTRWHCQGLANNDHKRWLVICQSLDEISKWFHIDFKSANVIISTHVYKCMKVHGICVKTNQLWFHKIFVFGSFCFVVLLDCVYPAVSLLYVFWLASSAFSQYLCVYVYVCLCVCWNNKVNVNDINNWFDGFHYFSVFVFLIIVRFSTLATCCSRVP